MEKSQKLNITSEKSEKSSPFNNNTTNKTKKFTNRKRKEIFSLKTHRTNKKISKTKEKKENINNIINNDRSNYNINKNNTFINSMKIKDKITNPNFKVKELLLVERQSIGKIDLFEIVPFNNNYYLVYPDFSNNFLILFNLLSLKIDYSLKGHMGTITTIKYFTSSLIKPKHNSKKYLVSSDTNFDIIIWNINNNFSIEHKIPLGFSPRQSILMLDINNEKDYLLTFSSFLPKFCPSYQVYGLQEKQFYANLSKSDESILYLIHWINPENKEDYVIFLCSQKIIINSFCDPNLYDSFEFKHTNFYYGCLNRNNNYLYAVYNNVILIFDLLNKKDIRHVSFPSGLTKIELWEDRYIIYKNDINKCLEVFDLVQNKAISRVFPPKNTGFMFFRIGNHPKYGKALIGANDGKGFVIMGH